MIVTITDCSHRDRPRLTFACDEVQGTRQMVTFTRPRLLDQVEHSVPSIADLIFIILDSEARNLTVGTLDWSWVITG